MYRRRKRNMNHNETETSQNIENQNPVEDINNTEVVSKEVVPSENKTSSHPYKKQYQKKYHHNYDRTSVNTTDPHIYKLFYLTRFHSLTQEEYLEKIKDTCKQLNLFPNQLTFQSCNLLVYSAMFNNSEMFKALINEYPKEFIQDIPKCIFMTYSNSGPDILDNALQFFHFETKEPVYSFLEAVTQNCFRKENAHIIQSWVKQQYEDKKLELTEIDQFVKLLLEKNNKPFLFEICRDTFWKTRVVQSANSLDETKLSEDFKFFLHAITQESHTFTSFHKNCEYDLRFFMNNEKPQENKNKQPQLSTTFQTGASNNNLKTPDNIGQPTVTVKKKLKISSL
jgi:hypothetical protein